jgi:hypothetical protein
MYAPAYSLIGRRLGPWSTLLPSLAPGGSLAAMVTTAATLTTGMALLLALAACTLARRMPRSPAAPRSSAASGHAPLRTTLVPSGTAALVRLVVSQSSLQPGPCWSGLLAWVPINPETAIVMAAKQRRSSVGAAFRAILATAEQFQIGARPPLELFNRDRDLVRLAPVNCGFGDHPQLRPRSPSHDAGRHVPAAVPGRLRRRPTCQGGVRGQLSLAAAGRVGKTGVLAAGALGRACAAGLPRRVPARAAG